MIPLDRRSKDLRLATIDLAKANGGYHLGGSFSCVEILRAVSELDGFPERFIMSKGHGCWPFYVLLRERGLNPKLEGHPSRDPANGVTFTTGSEGHGLPAALGLAWGLRMIEKEQRVTVLIGDGECQEGTTWESMLIAGKHRLPVTCIVDFNGIQGSGRSDDILPMRNAVCAVARTSGWWLHHCSGNSIDDMREALKIDTRVAPGPWLIMAHTIKGAGVSFMEDEPCWHARWLDPEHEAIAR